MFAVAETPESQFSDLHQSLSPSVTCSSRRELRTPIAGVGDHQVLPASITKMTRQPSPRVRSFPVLCTLVSRRFGAALRNPSWRQIRVAPLQRHDPLPPQPSSQLSRPPARSGRPDEWLDPWTPTAPDPAPGTPARSFACGPDADGILGTIAARFRRTDHSGHQRPFISARD